jgi:hypothetical protein
LRVHLIRDKRKSYYPPLIYVKKKLIFSITATAELIKEKKNKTLSGKSLLDAFKTLKFENYQALLMIYLKRYHSQNNNAAAQPGNGNRIKGNLQ